MASLDFAAPLDACSTLRGPHHRQLLFGTVGSVLNAVSSRCILLYSVCSTYSIKGALLLTKVPQYSRSVCQKRYQDFLCVPRKQVRRLLAF